MRPGPSRAGHSIKARLGRLSAARFMQLYLDAPPGADYSTMLAEDPNDAGKLYVVAEIGDHCAAFTFEQAEALIQAIDETVASNLAPFCRVELESLAADLRGIMAAAGSQTAEAPREQQVISDEAIEAMDGPGKELAFMRTFFLADEDTLFRSGVGQLKARLNVMVLLQVGDTLIALSVAEARAMADTCQRTRDAGVGLEAPALDLSNLIRLTRSAADEAERINLERLTS